VRRYLIFGLVGPLIGGFLLLIANTYMAGYWDETSASEVATLFKVFVSTLQYTYMFGILPALMLGAIDDIIYHIKRVPPVIRMLLVGAIAFAGECRVAPSRYPPLRPPFCRAPAERGMSAWS